MKCFTVFSLLALCIVATSHGFVLKDEKKSLVDGAVGIINNLKDSAVEKKAALIESVKGKKDSIIESVNEKKESIVGTVKEAATNKWNFVKGIKEANVNVVKNAFASHYAKLAAFKNAKENFAKNFINSNSAKFVQAYSAVSSKVQGLHQYKLNLKDKATSLVSSAASKIHSEIEKKKALFSTLKKPANSNKLVFLEPVEEKPEPITVHTYIRHEPAVAGTVYVPEYPVHQIYEETPVVYGPPANTYGPAIIPI